MKKYVCILIIATSYITTHAQDAATAKFMQQHVTVDGIPSEWQLPLNFYDADTKLLFAIANDSNNIYLCLESQDNITATKMMRAGVKILLSSKGKTKHEASITYPLQQKNVKNPDADALPNDSMHEQYVMHNTRATGENFASFHPVMNVEGFATVQGEIPVNNAAGIAVALNRDSASNLFYEVAIPKKEFFGNSYSDKDAASEINLNVEVFALQKNAMQQSGHRGGGGGDFEGRGMRGGGMRGGGMRGGFGGGGEGRQWNEGDRLELSSKTSFKQKFVLSKGND